MCRETALFSFLQQVREKTNDARQV